MQFAKKTIAVKDATYVAAKKIQSCRDSNPDLC